MTVTSGLARKRSDKAASSIPNWVLGAAGVATLLVLLEILPRIGVVDSRFLPPVSEMFLALGTLAQNASFWLALLHTLVTWASGLAITIILGVIIGILLGNIKWLRDFTASTIEFLRPVPSVALIPVAVLLFGPNMTATLFLVIYAAFWQVLIQVMAGVQDVDPVVADTARSYRFSQATRLRTVIWPTTLPYAMTGARLAASVALVLAVTGELLVSGEGIGGLLARARESGAVANMYGYIIVTGALGLLVNQLARGIESKTLFWHPSMRKESI